MLVYGLRLLVALITFGVGVAASTLLGSERKSGCGKRAVSYATAEAPRLVSVPTRDLVPLLGAPGNPYKDEGDVINRGMINPLEMRSKPAPSYPRVALNTGARGQVVVRVVVGVDGYVKAAEAVSGHPLLQASAVSAARQATFHPLLLSGQPVKFSGFLTYYFVNE